MDKDKSAFKSVVETVAKPIRKRSDEHTKERGYNTLFGSLLHGGKFRKAVVVGAYSLIAVGALTVIKDGPGAFESAEKTAVEVSHGLYNTGRTIGHVASKTECFFKGGLNECDKKDAKPKSSTPTNESSVAPLNVNPANFGKIVCSSLTKVPATKGQSIHNLVLEANQEAGLSFGQLEEVEGRYFSKSDKERISLILEGIREGQKVVISGIPEHCMPILETVPVPVTVAA